MNFIIPISIFIICTTIVLFVIGVLMSSAILPYSDYSVKDHAE